MESAVLGLALDSSVLVAAERKQLTTLDAIKKIRDATGDVPIVISSLTVAELGHGIYRAATPERSRQRRQFLDELKAQVPVHPVTETTAEIIARVGAEPSRQGNQPSAGRSNHRGLRFGTRLFHSHDQLPRLYPHPGLNVVTL